MDNFVVRMREVFNNQSGIEVPANQLNYTPYEQQLKNAILKRLITPIASFITKHMVNHRVCGLMELIEHARHAEKYLQSKRKTKKGKIFAVEEGLEVYVIEGAGNSRVLSRDHLLKITSVGRKEGNAFCVERKVMLQKTASQRIERMKHD